MVGSQITRKTNKTTLALFTIKKWCVINKLSMNFKLNQLHDCKIPKEKEREC